jgi:outer membrane protein TolC
VGDVQHMVDRELVPRSDVLAARVALANAEQVRVRAANSVEIAQAVYNRRLGEPLERSPELDGRVPADGSLTAVPIDVLVRRAIDSRSELKGLAARADSLASRSDAESGALRPQLALTGGYTHFDNQILDRGLLDGRHRGYLEPVRWGASAQPRRRVEQRQPSGKEPA